MTNSDFFSRVHSYSEQYPIFQPLRDIVLGKNTTIIDHSPTNGRSQECVVLLTDQQANVALSNALTAARKMLDQTSNRRHKRKMENFKRWPYAKWTSTVHYKFDGQHCK